MIGSRRLEGSCCDKNPACETILLNVIKLGVELNICSFRQGRFFDDFAPASFLLSRSSFLRLHRIWPERAVSCPRLLFHACRAGPCGFYPPLHSFFSINGQPTHPHAYTYI